MRAETTKAVTELLAQMQSVLITPDLAYGARRDAIRDLSDQLLTQTRMACIPLPEPIKVNWVGSTMVV